MEPLPGEVADIVDEALEPYGAAWALGDEEGGHHALGVSCEDGDGARVEGGGESLVPEGEVACDLGDEDEGL